MLPSIRAAVGKRLTLFIDSGFRRGSDIAIALALGADAIFVGRATLYGLAAGGARGVSRALEILRTELDRVLALIGVPSVDELRYDLLVPVERSLVEISPHIQSEDRHAAVTASENVFS